MVAHGYTADCCCEQSVPRPNPELGPPRIWRGPPSLWLQTTDLHPLWPPILRSSTASRQESSLQSWADRWAGWSLLIGTQRGRVPEATVPEIN